MKIKNVLLKLRDVVEIWIPSIMFILMFVVFVAQVIARYVFKNPFTWSYEITVTGFAWTVILGACYAMRARTHVTFTMIYDSVSPMTGALLRLIGNIIIVIAFLMLIIPTVKYLKFVSFQMTAVFRIPLSFIYAPFAYFLCSIVGYTITDIFEDIKTLTGKESEKEVSL